MHHYTSPSITPKNVWLRTKFGTLFKRFDGLTTQTRRCFINSLFCDVCYCVIYSIKHLESLLCLTDTLFTTFYSNCGESSKMIRQPDDSYRTAGY